MTFVLPPTAQKGFTNATSYDQHRPSYPSAAVSSLLEHLGVNGQNGARILEVGAGTGKFTELLVAREEAFEILAVEPHARMREELERKRLKGVTSLEGNSAALPLGSGDVVDAVVAAQKTKQQVLDGMAEGEVVKNDRGEVLLHGVTFLSWTGKI
ncbi:MAG: hypothetical protein M1825_000304 [Sarcosagium campestre]|nr:MAG: hypothetical protein M1825_000304 [Sarcosagium campestre]